MMKNVAMTLAVMVALVCSQACAQKKAELASAGKSPSSAKTTTASTKTVAVSKKIMDSPPAAESKEPAQWPSTKKKTSSSLGSETTPSKISDKTSGKTSGKSSNEKASTTSARSEELTDDQKKKIKSLLRQAIKTFAAADLTEEQKRQADELFAKALRDYVIKRSQAMITDELQKKHAAAFKEVSASAKNASAKNAREQAKQAFIQAGFSDEQIKVFKATQTSLDKAKKSFAKSLSSEQIEALPEALRTLVNTGATK